MSVSKRGKVWYLHIWPFGKLINLRTSADSRAEAKQIESALKTALRSGDYRALQPKERETAIRLFDNQGWEKPETLAPDSIKPVEELTLGKAFEICLNYPGIKDAPNRGRYIQAFAHFTLKWGINRAVKSIWIPDIKLYQQDRLKAGATPSTVNKERAALSKMFSCLQELQFIEINPCTLVKGLSEKSGERQVYISFDDFNRILGYLPEWFRPIAQIAYYTGMRRGEIVGLTRKQIDLRARMIYLGPQDTKEGKWKRVPIHMDLVPVLEEALSGSVLNMTGLIFSKDGKPITKDQLRRSWDGHAEKAFIEPAEKIQRDKRKGEKPVTPRFHDLRHTWKTNARRSGVHPEIAEAIMGHATRARSVTERYGFVSDEEFVKAIDQMTFEHGETRIWVAS